VGRPEHQSHTAILKHYSLVSYLAHHLHSPLSSPLSSLHDRLLLRSERDPTRQHSAGAKDWRRQSRMVIRPLIVLSVRALFHVTTLPISTCSLHDGSEQLVFLPHGYQHLLPIITNHAATIEPLHGQLLDEHLLLHVITGFHGHLHNMLHHEQALLTDRRHTDPHTHWTSSPRCQLHRQTGQCACAATSPSFS